MTSSQQQLPLRVLELADRLGRAGGQWDGATTYFTTVYPALARAGLELTACFMAERHPAAAVLEEHGLEPLFLGRAKYDLRAARDVARIVRARRIQLLRLAGLKAHLIGRVVAWRQGCRAVIHLHDCVPLSPPIGFLQRRLAPLTDLCLTVSEPLVEFGVEQYALPRSKVVTLYNGVPLGRYERSTPEARRKLGAELGIAADAPLIAMVGRLDPMKGHDHAIRAMPEVLKAAPNAVLVIAGTGLLSGSLEALARQTGVGHAVVFCGFRDDIPELLAAAHVLAIPTTFAEGMPYAAIEAIAAGVPVVAYPTVGIPRVVLDEQTGLLVPQGDEGALAAALVRLLRDHELHARLSAGARAHARTFSLEKHVERLVGIYRSLVEQPERGLEDPSAAGADRLSDPAGACRPG